jgi:hypothetical protein
MEGNFFGGRDYATWIDVNIEIILFKLLKGHKS